MEERLIGNYFTDRNIAPTKKEILIKLVKIDHLICHVGKFFTGRSTKNKRRARSTVFFLPKTMCFLYK